MWPPILWETNTADHRRSVLCGTRDLNQMMELVGRVQFLNLVSVKKNPPVNVIKLIGRKKVEISHVTETTRKGHFKRN